MTSVSDFCMLATNYVVRLEVIMDIVDSLTALFGCSVHPVGVVFVNWSSSIRLANLDGLCMRFVSLFLCLELIMDMADAIT